MYPKPLAKRIKILLLFTGLLFSLSISAQNKITGRISSSEDKQPIAGASINVKGTSTQTVSDNEGNFQLSVKPRDVLVISYTGFQTREIAANDQASINVILSPSNSSLNEVVVTGYTTQLKKDITGSVSTVNVAAAKKLPVSSSEQLLQGQASGVNVLTSGVPGGANFISIRGIPSFGNSSPLYVIDGVQSTSMSDVNPNDIESISVLKDAGAAAIYGVSGGNGVIVITTKKGKPGASTISYDGFYGVTQPLQGNVFHLTGVQEIAKFNFMVNPQSKFFAGGQIPDFGYQQGGGAKGFANAGDSAVDPAKYNYDPTDITGPNNDYLIQAFQKTGRGTDWFHEAFRNAPTQSHTVSASGSNNKNAYFLSFQYLDQEGTLINTYKKRYSGRVNNTFNIRNNIRIGETLLAFYTQTPGPFLNQNEGSPIAYIAGASPIIPVFDIKGNYGGGWDGPGDIGARNPVAIQKMTSDNYDKTWTIQATGFAEVDFLKHFTARTSLSFTTINDYNKTIGHNQYFDIIGHNLPTSDVENSSYSSTRQWTSTLVYTQSFAKHNIKVLGGLEQIQFRGSGQGGGVNDLFSLDPNYVTLSNGTSNISNYSFIAQPWRILSFFGRLDYSYAGKYLLGATIRRDGYSGFVGSQTYANFPSLSVGWRLSQESFMNNIDWLNDLKIRASIGTAGSKANVPGNNAYSTYSSGPTTGSYSLNGTTLTNGFYQAQQGNPFTHWESDKISNIGIDATILANSLDVTVEYYKKSISGLLFQQPLLATYGAAASPFINIGDIQNKGVDASLNYHGSSGKDFRYNIGINFTSYKNTVVSVPGNYFDASYSSTGYFSRNQVGHPVGAFYGYKVIGYFKDSADVAKSPVEQDAAPGRFKYADINHDGVITPDDRTFFGDPNPKFTYGINLGASFRNFDFSMFFYGSQGNMVMSYRPGLTIDQYTNSWTPQNLNPKYPIAESGSYFSTDGVINSWAMEDGSFLKCRYVTLGYSFNEPLIKKAGLNRLHIYAQVVNLFKITKYSGLDPELTPSASNLSANQQSAGFGVDYGNYPNTERQFIAGINLTF
jgi:TonB-dependent starch-binding outer membrane protein SusC